MKWSELVCVIVASAFLYLTMGAQAAENIDNLVVANMRTISGVITANVEHSGNIRVAAMNSSGDRYYQVLQNTNNIIYSTVATNGWFAIRSVPVLSSYWVVAFVDVDTNGAWSPIEFIGSYPGNDIYLTNDYAGADITLGYGDWDYDGINDDDEAYILLSNPSNSLSPIQVDDDGPNDPAPGDPEMSDSAENGTRFHPFDAIQEAVNLATSGSVVVVRDGSYSGIGNKDIALKGKAITVRSQHGYNSTTIDVASVHSGFICASNETASTLIAGFTIHTWSDYFGREGIYCKGSRPTIEDCRIWDCGVAGILCTNGASPTIRRTIIEGNSGGVRCYGSSPIFERCLIQSNFSGRGAGIYVESNSHPYLVNTIITGNRSTNDGGGLYVGTGCNPTGINCTLAYNVATNRGSAISTAGNPLFKNVIVWGNVDPASDPINLLAAATFTYSCVQEFHPGTGNKTNDPVLVSSSNYRLQITSPCLDSGTAVGAPTNDFEGQVRPMDGEGNGIAIIDMGAYERTNYQYVATNAMTHYVSASSPSPLIPYTNWATAATRIQNAIDVAYPGALILVSNGVYAAGGKVVYGALTNRVAITKPMTVLSVNGPEFTVIQGIGPSGASAVRCAYIGSNALLSGFTLINGSTRGYSGDYIREQNGGGAWLESSAVLSNCVIVENTATDGGGGVYGGTLNNCSLISNSARYGYCSGGGARASTLNCCTLIGNSAFSGGGAAACTLNNCTLSSNWVEHPTGPGGGDSYGGGAYSCTLLNCLLVGNRSGLDGGGASSSVLSNCTLLANSAEFGGGVSRGTLYNCILSGNTASERGGGVDGGTLYNCTVSDNTASEGGGAYGTATAWGACLLYNSILFNNHASVGADYSGATLSYSCAFPDPGGIGNITNAPLFVNAAALNYRLQSNSPCINRGLNQPWMVTALDLDGNPRVYANGVVDMGAYEYPSSVTFLATDWLAQYGLAADGSEDFSDSDADGFSNWAEWRSGTNPTNDQSFFECRQLEGTMPQGLVIRWPSITDRTYSLERSLNLMANPAFTNIAAGVQGQLGFTSYTDTSATASGSYIYRVKVE